MIPDEIKEGLLKAAKKDLEAGCFVPLMLFVAEVKGYEGLLTIPVKHSEEFFIKNFSRSTIKYGLNLFWKAYKEEFDLTELKALVILSDCNYTAYHADSKTKADSLIKDLEKGKIPMPSKSPHRIEALLTIFSEQQGDEVKLLPYERSQAGRIEFTLPVASTSGFDGRLMRLFPEFYPVLKK